jgi:hypothetical protein
MAKTLTDMYVNKILDRQKELARGTLAIPTADYGTYRQRCGQWEGLEEALNILHDLIKGDEDGQI